MSYRRHRLAARVSQKRDDLLALLAEFADQPRKLVLDFAARCAVVAQNIGRARYRCLDDLIVLMQRKACPLAGGKADSICST